MHRAEPARASVLGRAVGWLGLAAAWLLMPCVAPAQDAGPPHRSTHLTAISWSGQFVVVGPRDLPRLSRSSPQDKVLDLTPQTLAVSCERVKGEILRALGMRDGWRRGGDGTGLITVTIDPLVSTNTPLAVQAVRYERGWRFRTGVPPRVSEDSLVRLLTQAIVTELASRHGNERTGEPPLWLIEALTQTVLTSRPTGVIVEPESRLVAEMRLGERLARVRDMLAAREPLDFRELCQPDLTRMKPEDWEHYSACAHLFLRELSRLPGGESRLARWVTGLQRHWNWQSGFLEVYEAEFRSLLDVEKWWALTVADFTGRDFAQSWSAEFTLQKLDEILQPVGILPGAGNRAARLKIEEVIETWDFVQQLPVLRRLAQQLNALRINAPPELKPLVLQYLEAVQDYLQARSRSGLAPLARSPAVADSRGAVRVAVGRLRELDGERQALQIARE